MSILYRTGTPTCGRKGGGMMLDRGENDYDLFEALMRRHDEHMIRVREEVGSWPQWKQDVLGVRRSIPDAPLDAMRNSSGG